ncbi:MAG: hydrogenase nickel incorporation protein HypB [Deltaproteobacteria bacterium]|nr:hydrogenase nickel incorporation protein HypB [Candidatus Anaeroferrophillacea bacterium]
MKPGIKLIEVKEDLFADNRRAAETLRARLRASRTFLLNLMASPGAGKTSLIMQTVAALAGELRLGVIEADIDSMIDAETVAAGGIPALQLRTGGFCHVDAVMVGKALAELPLKDLDLVILENVGNLVCPAEFDTGASRSAMILSVPEGDDKPLKYPLMFSVCNALVVNKTDWLELSDFSVERLTERVRRLNPGMELFPLSCRTGEGIEAWTDWLRREVAAFLN